MITPSFQRLREMKADGECGISNATDMHPNPRLYKYWWRVFHEDLPSENYADIPSLPTVAAFALIERLESAGKPYIVYNHRQRRLGVKIWDYSKFPMESCAPAYDDDPDPMTEEGFR